VSLQPNVGNLNCRAQPLPGCRVWQHGAHRPVPHINIVHIQRLNKILRDQRLVKQGPNNVCDPVALAPWWSPLLVKISNIISLQGVYQSYYHKQSGYNDTCSHIHHTIW
jgi:hypothetical protein